MATSSFTKTFVFNTEATKKFQEIQKKPGVVVPSPSSDRLKEGERALAQFSPRSKK